MKTNLAKSGDRILCRHIAMDDSAYFVKLTLLIEPSVYHFFYFFTLHVYYNAGCSPCSSFLTIFNDL